MGRAILAAIFVAFLALPAAAKNYLSDQGAFDSAWQELAGEAGVYDKLQGRISRLMVRPDIMVLIAQPKRNSFDLHVWRVQREDHLIWGERDTVSYVGPQVKAGRFINGRESLFDIRDIALDRLIETGLRAAEPVVFEWTPKLLEVTIEREYVGLRDEMFRKVQWQIQAGSPGDRAKIEADAAGTFIGADITLTVKGRNRDFFSQLDWPYADAQQGLAERIGDGEVLRVTARRESISVTVTSPKSRQITPSYSWDGGRYKHNAMNMMGQRWHLLGGRGTFALSDIDLTDLHGMIALARGFAGQPGAGVSDVVVTSESAPGDGHEVQWTTTLFDPERGGMGNSSEHWIVSVRADGSLAKLRLPDHARPFGGFLDPAALALGLQHFATAVGADAEVYQILFGERDAVMVRRDAIGGTGFAEVKLDARQLTSVPTVSNGDPGELFFFRMGKTAGLTEDGILQMYRAAIDAVGVPGAEVFQARLWGGKKRIFDLGGEPMILLHVAEPGVRDPKGIVAFKTDGSVLQVFK